METRYDNNIYLQKERMSKIMVTNCVRLSNDSNFFRCSDKISVNNTYFEILDNRMNINNSIAHSISKNMESVVIFIYDSRSGLIMKPDIAKSLSRLNDIRKLPDDWNGYGARAFTDTLVYKCERIINLLSIQPSIYPTGRNSIQFQYELGDKSYLELEIFEDRTLCLQVPKRIYSKAKEWQLTDSEESQIKEIVDNFYGSNSAEK